MKPNIKDIVRSRKNINQNIERTKSFSSYLSAIPVAHEIVSIFYFAITTGIVGLTGLKRSHIRYLSGEYTYREYVGYMLYYLTKLLTGIAVAVIFTTIIGIAGATISQYVIATSIGLSAAKSCYNFFKDWIENGSKYRKKEVLRNFIGVFLETISTILAAGTLVATPVGVYLGITAMVLGTCFVSYKAIKLFFNASKSKEHLLQKIRLQSRERLKLKYRSQRFFRRISKAMDYYQTEKVQTLRHFSNVSEEDKTLLASIKKHLTTIKELYEENLQKFQALNFREAYIYGKNSSIENKIIIETDKIVELILNFYCEKDKAYMHPVYLKKKIQQAVVNNLDKLIDALPDDNNIIQVINEHVLGDANKRILLHPFLMHSKTYESVEHVLDHLPSGATDVISVDSNSKEATAYTLSTEQGDPIYYSKLTPKEDGAVDISTCFYDPEQTGKIKEHLNYLIKSGVTDLVLEGQREHVLNTVKIAQSKELNTTVVIDVDELTDLDTTTEYLKELRRYNINHLVVKGKHQQQVEECAEKLGFSITQSTSNKSQSRQKKQSKFSHKERSMTWSEGMRSKNTQTIAADKTEANKQSAEPPTSRQSTNNP